MVLSSIVCLCVLCSNKMKLVSLRSAITSGIVCLIFSPPPPLHLTEYCSFENFTAFHSLLPILFYLLLFLLHSAIASSFCPSSYLFCRPFISILSFCSFSLSSLSHSFFCILSSLFKTFLWPMSSYTDKKEKKIFLIYKEIQRDREHSHIWLTASSYMVKYLRISSHIRKPFRIYDFAPDPILWISLYMRKILFSFLSV